MKPSAFIICLAVFFLSGRCFAQVFLKLSNDSIKVLQYSGGDEFNATSINENVWSLKPYPSTNMGQFFAYESANTSVENGVVIFTLKKKDSVYTIHPGLHDSSFLKRSKLKLLDNKFPMKYSAGIIISKQKFHYGLYELRFKVEEGKGVWPAFWFFGGNKNEEIDAFELKGEKNNLIHVDTHCPYGCDRGYKNKLGFNTNWGDWMPVKNYLHKGYNIMILEWLPGEVIWYINGYPLAYFKGNFTNPMNLYLNTQVASNYSAFQPAPDESTPCPNNFYVDYLRVWSYAPENTVAALKESKMTVSDRFASDYRNKALRHKGLMYVKKKFNAEQGMISLNLLSGNRLNVCVLGELNTEETELTLKGAFGNYTIKPEGSDATVTLDQRENKLELVIKTKSKTYTQQLLINR